MSYEDAVPNTKRADAIRAYVAQIQEGYPGKRNTEIPIAYASGVPGDRTPLLTADDMLCAANALEAQGVKGYAAARVYAETAYGDPAVGDTILEAADTFDDTLGSIRKELGDAIVDEAIYELTGEDV